MNRSRGNGSRSAAFAGDIEVLAFDAAAMTLQLLGKGADRGGSSASMNLTATIEPGDTPATSVLVGHAEVIVNGKFAQFGGRLMVQVSDMLLGQFVDNFRVAAAALPMEGVATTTEAATEPAQTAAMTAAAPAISPAPTATPFVPAALAKANEINALAIFWHLVKGWFSGLFGGKRA